MTILDTRHLVDPELRPLLDVFPVVTLDDETLKAMRARELPQMPVEADGVDLQRRTIPGPDGQPKLPIAIYRPERPAGLVGCIFHVHGGGYVAGSSAEFDFVLRPIASALGCVIVSVDYRLAPEAVFPAAIGDCHAGLVWTFANADELGVDAARIGVMGESAGGGLAAALALMARDRGEHRLAFQYLTYPMIDDRTCVREPHPTAGEFVWHAHNNHFGWRALLGEEPGGADVSPYAAASRAQDLSGLPPTVITTGALDLFLDEDVDYARRLMAAGVPTELHVYPGAIHGFDLVPGPAIADRARADRVAALARLLS